MLYLIISTNAIFYDQKFNILLTIGLKVTAMMIPLLSFGFLLIALGSIVLYQKANGEATKILAASGAVVFLLSGFALAHWSIHLLSLLLLFNLRVSENLLQTVRINK